MLNRVGVNRFLKPAVHRQIGLLIHFEPQRAHAHWPGDGGLVHGRGHQAVVDHYPAHLGGLHAQ